MCEDGTGDHHVHPYILVAADHFQRFCRCDQGRLSLPHTIVTTDLGSGQHGVGFVDQQKVAVIVIIGDVARLSRRMLDCSGHLAKNNGPDRLGFDRGLERQIAGYSVFDRPYLRDMDILPEGKSITFVEMRRQLSR